MKKTRIRSLSEYAAEIAQDLSDSKAVDFSLILKEDGRLLIAADTGIKSYGYVLENLAVLKKNGRTPEYVADKIRIKLIEDFKEDLWKGEI